MRAALVGDVVLPGEPAGAHAVGAAHEPGARARRDDRDVEQPVVVARAADLAAAAEGAGDRDDDLPGAARRSARSPSQAIVQRSGLAVTPAFSAPSV